MRMAIRYAPVVSDRQGVAVVVSLSRASSEQKPVLGVFLGILYDWKEGRWREATPAKSIEP